MAPGKARRVDIGLRRGAILSVRLTEDVYKSLRTALSDGSDSRWHELETEEETVSLDLSEVIYVSLETEAGSVGF